MTADDARELVSRSGKSKEAETLRQAKLWHECWMSLIEKEAKSGKRNAHEENIDIPRTPISPEAKSQALDALARDGFTVYRDERKVCW